MNFYIEQWLKVLEENMEGQLEIRGPAPAPIEKIRDEYRFQLWYFAPSASRVISQLAKQREQFKMDKEVIDLIDVDPMNMS